MLHDVALMHREEDLNEGIEHEDVPFDIVAAAETCGNAKPAHCFTILGLIRLMI